MDFIFRIDIGYEPQRGFVAVCLDVKNNVTCQGKGHSIRELMRHINRVICNQEQSNRRFPMESGEGIIIPNKAEKDLFGLPPPSNLTNGE